MEDIRMCTVIPEDEIPETGGGMAAHDSDGADMAMESDYMWENGANIKIRMYGGSPYVRKMVKKYARVWLKYANLHMDFVNSGHADIRITFDKGGSWSRIGTDCKNVKGNKPTMNFGWFHDNTKQREFSRTVTHEFGHALGCIHEHQNPAGNIRWNKPKAYEYWMRTQGWSKKKVDHNIFRAYSVDITQFSRFDRKSIMLYSIPAALTTNGFSTARNNVLSETDIKFISKAYPKGKKRTRRHNQSYSQSGSERESESESASESESSSDSESDSDSDCSSGSDLPPLDRIFVRGRWVNLR